MKDIKRRQKGFVALLLAVVIGLLPSVSVWAATTYTVFNKDTTGTNNCIDCDIRINGVAIKNYNAAKVTPASGVTGHIIFYAAATDVIESSTLTDAQTTFDKDGNNAADDPEVNYPENTDPPSVPKWNNTTKITLRSPNTIWNGMGTKNGWLVDVTLNAANGQPGEGTVTDIRFVPADVFNIKYIDTITGAQLADNLTTNPSVMPKLGAGATNYDHTLKNINKPGYNFAGWFEQNTFATQAITLRSAYDNTANVGKLYTDGDGFQHELEADNTDGYYYLYAQLSAIPAPGPSGGGGSYTPTPTPIPKRTLTYDPNNSIEANKSTSETITEGTEITLPENQYQSQPGQLFMGWQVVDPTYDTKDEEGNIVYPRYGKGDIYQPGDKLKITADTTFIAVWADNPTFRMDCPDEYELMPPENTMEALEKRIH